MDIFSGTHLRNKQRGGLLELRRWGKAPGARICFGRLSDEQRHPSIKARQEFGLHSGDHPGRCSRATDHIAMLLRRRLASCLPECSALVTYL